MRINELEIRLTQRDFESDFKKIKKIVKKYDQLLAEKGLTNPDYWVSLIPRKCAEFFSKDEDTKNTMEKITLKDSEKILKKLSKLAKKTLGSYILDRDYFYR